MHVKNIILVLLGSAITAVGLQYFLLPNHLLDGGVTGLSILASSLSGIPLGVLLALLNAPFVWFGYKKFGKTFASYSLIGIVTLAALTIGHIDQGLTGIPILAAVFGGVVVGVGVGIVIRYGGVIDGDDMVAVLIDKVTVFSVGEAIMLINSLIITLAGFVFGWDNALYSLIAYFVVHKTVDVTVQGLDEDRCMWVVSMNIREIGGAINRLAVKPVTYIKEASTEGTEPHGMLLAVITRFDEQKLKKAIRAIDSHAYVVLTSAHEVLDRVSEGSLYQRPGIDSSSKHG